MTELPRSRRRCSVPSSARLSRWCNPMDGSSSTYSTPVRFDPIWVASRMRWPSPPDSVAALRPSVREPILHLPQDALGDDPLAIRQLDAIECIERLADGQAHVVLDRTPLHPHGQA